MEPLRIDGHRLTLAEVVAVARDGLPVALSSAAKEAMAASQAWVQAAADGELRDEDGSELAIYGVNTGYGSLSRVRIGHDDITALSRNLLRSHAAGVGDPVARDAARAMVLLRANALAQGSSGCRPVLVERLLDLLNHGVDPVIPSQGSCGSSGDLAPLSHLGLIITHAPEDPDSETGEAWVGSERMSGRAALQAVGLEPLVPGPKEGLAITNGAQLTTAIAGLACHDARELVVRAEIAAAMSIEALLGVTRAFHPAVHRRRPYPGAQACAANLLRLLAGSGWVDSVPDKVQDAYALRCTPPVLGGVRDGIEHVHRQLLVELNAVTDNPLICLDIDGPDKAMSAGLFHGEPVGLVADYLKILVAEVASLAERRLYRLLTGLLSANLPASLARRDRPGLGLLALQTTAAALVSENKALGWPASLDSIPTCEDQEDHVAMSTTAARRAAEVVENASKVVDIELLCAARALSYRCETSPEIPLGQGTAAALQMLEPALRGGMTPAEAVAVIGGIVRGSAFTEAVERSVGGLLPVGGVPKAAP